MGDIKVNHRMEISQLQYLKLNRSYNKHTNNTAFHLSQKYLNVNRRDLESLGQWYGVTSPVITSE